MSDQTKSETLDNLGAQPSIVESFTIEGLYGYRTISLSSNYAATILIAKNGSGKTTLLGALDAFLRGEFIRLSSLQFSTIRCKLRGIESELSLTWEETQALLNIPQNSEIYKTAQQCEIPLSILYEFLTIDYNRARRSIIDLNENEIFSKIRSGVAAYSSVEARKTCDRLFELTRTSSKNIELIHSALKKALGDAEIVYLPTYRRIELPLDEEKIKADKVRGRRRTSIQSRLGLSKRGLFNTDIQFGLADISERLSDLNQDILFNSSIGYREISANIISELLDGTFDSRQGSVDEDIPDRESLLLFLSRVKESRHVMEPHRGRDPAIPDIDRIYNQGGSSDTSNKFLQYFLVKLNTVIHATRNIESLVEEFIDHCNTYLSAQDPSTAVGFNSSSPDDKQLRLDRKTLKVHVENLAAQRKIPLDSLSSGEKQMISLFAKLYLYRGQKILLIDEPELSLSIDWQRKILVDVVNAPTCAQAIAITHSPFIFDNALEPYAKSIDLRIDVQNQPSAEEDEYESEDGLNE